MNDEDVSVGVTAFIDILGFGNKVKEAETVDDIRKIHDQIKLIHDAFDFDTHDELTLEVQKLHETTVLAFSDCVVINIPLESDATKYDGTFDPIMQEITSFAYGQGICCQNELFIRGGLDLGWWYQSGSTLISQSMVNAYKTENAASVPVIALTKEFFDYFSQHAHRGFYNADFDPIPRVFRKYKDESREFYYLDYITICLDSLSWHYSMDQIARYRSSGPDEKDEIMSEGYRRNVDNWLKAHALNIQNAHRIADEDNVKSKYEWLSSYHNEIANNFTRNPSCQCSLSSV